MKLDHTTQRLTRRLPAEEGVWVFIIADLLMFGLFFNLYAYYRSLTPELFNASQATLNATIGLANMLLLLTGSWFIVKALHAIRVRQRAAAQRWIGLGLATGFGFVVIKLIEYGQKIGAGVTPLTNDFYMYYFVFTGIHLIHLLLGIAVLIWTLFKVRSSDWNERDMRLIEGGFAYWHLVDLLWIVLFPLIYLLH